MSILSDIGTKVGTEIKRVDDKVDAIGSGSGKVLQVIQNLHDGFVTAAGTAFVASGVKVSITKTTNTSKFKVMATGPLNSRPAANGCGVVLRMSVNGGTATNWALGTGNIISGGFMYDSAAADLWAQFSLIGFDNAGSSIGDVIEFEVYFTAQGPGTDGSTTARIGHTDFQSTIIVEEIAN